SLQGDEDIEPGKATIDLTDLPGSIGKSVGGIAEMGAGLFGGVAGAVGSIGFGDGRHIGALAGVPGNALAAGGGVGPPSTNPNIKPTVGDILPTALGALMLPGKGIERTVAGQRVETARG